MTSAQVSNQISVGLCVWHVDDSASMQAPHIHADLEINMPLSGDPPRYLQAGRIFEVPLGRMALFWGGMPHQLLAPSHRHSGVWLTLPLQWAIEWELPGNPIGRLLSGEVFMEDEQAASPELPLRWVDDFQSGDPPRQRTMRLEIEARIRRLILSSKLAQSPQLQPTSRAEAILQKITAYLTRHYTRRVTMDSVARSVGLHPRYMMRVFKELTGLTVGEYLTRLRIAHAQQLLISTQEKIIDLAQDSGFETASAFYAAFQRFGGGTTPGRFRASQSVSCTSSASVLRQQDWLRGVGITSYSRG